MSSERDKTGQSTRAVHAGERGPRPRVGDSITVPIVQSATYWFRDTQEVIAYQEGRHASFEYGRYGNPTTRALEEKLAGLEGGEDCVVSASGMNSVTTLLLALMPQNGHLVTTHDCYRRTRQFMQTLLPKMGIRTTVVDPSDLAGIERALDAGATLFFSESPTNPYLRVVDIPRVAELCRDRGAISVIDSTFATPVNQQALSFGADLVLHSATKYLGGHNDVLGGALVGRADLIRTIRDLHGVLGGVIDPHTSYLILRGVKTLALRVERANRNAEAISRFLEQHRRGERVHYPGLESHRDHAVAKRLMKGFGGVISFEVRGSLETASKFIDALRIPYIAPSLGGVESLVEQPTVVSYWDKTVEERAALGIRDNLVRYSCGVEDTDDLIRDIEQALDRA
ncbi:MAG: aminotransferase class I/II-fold pyridoxal phosphate-dependent enzyme [Deltaproteobacteria bacterium]|nr:aminotransferase class I/II-fold pyridoxal phosphate-dependent enzyme [Deltaproteobacteria bacterium]